MIEAAVLDSTLSASVAFRMAVIAFCFVQPARFTRGGLSIAPTTVGVPGRWLVPKTRYGRSRGHITC